MKEVLLAIAVVALILLIFLLCKMRGKKYDKKIRIKEKEIHYDKINRHHRIKNNMKIIKKKDLESFIGIYCKIVTKERGDDRASVVIGTLEDVDYKDGFVLIDSEQGLGCLRINTIIAITHAQKHKLH